MLIPESIQELITRLEKSFADVGVSDSIERVFYDEREDIVTVKLHHHVNEVEFCSFVDSKMILKKNDQIAVSRL